MQGKPRLAVVSPFLDKQHGTERGVCEWVSRLADDFDIYIYSQRVEDINLSKMHWRKVARVPGPHLINYVWWFAANHVWRWYDEKVRDLRHDIVFSPGINCSDADVMTVHVVFADLYEQKEEALRLRHSRLASWPKKIHRHLYYRFIMQLEKRIYCAPGNAILPISSKTAIDLRRFYNRCKDLVPLPYPGVDLGTFNPGLCTEKRQTIRQKLGLAPDTFVLLLVGNDWHNKGLPWLINALHILKDPAIFLLVAGSDEPRQFRDQISAYDLETRIRFLPPQQDIASYYAAADAYVGPSLAEAFCQPIAEAMACGLPVIASARAGAAELVRHGVNGLILQDPRNAMELAALIKRLHHDSDERQRMSRAAVATIRGYTWDRSASQLGAAFRQVIEARRGQKNGKPRGNAA